MSDKHKQFNKEGKQVTATYTSRGAHGTTSEAHSSWCLHTIAHVPSVVIIATVIFIAIATIVLVAVAVRIIAIRVVHSFTHDASHNQASFMTIHVCDDDD